MSIASQESITASQTYDQVIDELLRPEVNRIDHEGYYPEPFMKAYGAAGAFQPVTEPGSLYEAIDNCSLVGQVCGSTAFSIWCHNTCLWYLQNTTNLPLKDKYLKNIASASILGATGLSNPVKSFLGIERMKLKGEKTPTGYRVKGTLPWVSNLLEGHVFGGIFDTDDGPIMALFDCSRADIRLKPSGPFIALEGTATQAVTFLNAEIPEEMILAHDAKAFVNQVKGGFILLQLGIGIGLMEGSIKDMHKANRTLAHTNCYLEDPPEHFENLLYQLKQRVKSLAQHPVENATNPSLFKQILQVRLDAAEITRKTTYASFLHQGSRGYLERGSGQRRVREAMFFDILSPSIKHLRQWLKILDNSAQEINLNSDDKTIFRDHNANIWTSSNNTNS